MRVSTQAEKTKHMRILGLADTLSVLRNQGAEKRRQIILKSGIFKQAYKTIVRNRRAKGFGVKLEDVPVGPSPERQYFIKRIKCFGTFTPVKKIPSSGG